MNSHKASKTHITQGQKKTYVLEFCHHTHLQVVEIRNVGQVPFADFCTLITHDPVFVKVAVLNRYPSSVRPTQPMGGIPSACRIRLCVSDHKVIVVINLQSPLTSTDQWASGTPPWRDPRWRSLDNTTETSFISLAHVNIQCLGESFRCWLCCSQVGCAGTGMIPHLCSDALSLGCWSRGRIGTWIPKWCARQFCFSRWN